MAKIKLNPLFEEIHGKFGDVVFKRGPGGKTIMTRVPRMPKKTRSQRLAQKNRMTDAHAFARSAMADPELRSYYEMEAEKKGKRAYSLALTYALQGQ